MTQYDKIFNSTKTIEESLNPEEAVAAIAVVTEMADLSIDEVDGEVLASILWDFEVFEDYSEEEIAQIVDRLIGIAEKHGIGTLFNIASKSLSDELILDAFAVGVMVMIDEDDLIIPQQKHPYLKQLQHALDLEDEEAHEIIQEVIAAYQEAENEIYLDDEDTVIIRDYGDEIYESPAGNFSVPIPVDPQQGGKVETQDGVVGFFDHFGTMLRIDYSPISSEQLEQVESIGQEEYLQSILLNKYVPETIFANMPKAEVRYTEYLKDAIEGSYFALIDMPHGSTISQSTNNGTATRLDAYRGAIAFMHSNYLYIVSSQHSFFHGEKPTSIKEEAEEIKENILDFVETIDFIETE
ncbi:tellurite resistance TerB family protein [Nodularia harveyana UHCC-0300]|uniref:Tellurite resistance TerB family protein n=1 Tax=Nodularia harveyana UHCC-0300 TaxID=2974287 RepID=A0ABU5UKB0_9CYAN|nr:tellurite resistance TerB family protein [Nodularia harveyana]MEA5582871.1 tellurite resistance TerB family protein [Nodularia harveyana UHCC-0300]